MEGFWLQAERNLAPAVNDFSAGFYDGAVADSLQAAELALKALIMEVTGKAARKTHDLVLLERALSASGRQASPSVAAAIGRLPESVWIEARYPDVATGHVPARDVTATEAQQALADGTEVVLWVKAQL